MSRLIRKILESGVTAALCFVCWQILADRFPVPPWLGLDHLSFLIRLVAVFALLTMVERVLGQLRSGEPEH